MTPRSWVMKMIAALRSLLQFAQQPQHLRLGGHVHGRRRFVGDEQARVARQRHGDHGALAQAAAQLPRVSVQALLGHRDAHVAKQLERDLARLALVDLVGGA